MRNRKNVLSKYVDRADTESIHNNDEWTHPVAFSTQITTTKKSHSYFFLFGAWLLLRFYHSYGILWHLHVLCSERECEEKEDVNEKAFAFFEYMLNVLELTFYSYSIFHLCSHTLTGPKNNRQTWHAHTQQCFLHFNWQF